MGNSDFYEGLFLIHPVENQPDDQKSCHPLNKAVPGTEPFRQSPDKNIADMAEIEQARDHVDEDRIHPDNFEQISPFAEAPDIDDEIKQAEE